MSTLILFFQTDPLEPIIIAANRDSTLERPTADPRMVEPGVFRPVDGLYGGSWFGFNERGLAAVVTHKLNSGDPSPPRSVSRGLLVSRALDNNHGTPHEALVSLKRRWECYRSHHLLVASRKEARILVGHHNERHELPVDTGFHLVSSLGHWSDHSERALLVRRQIEGETNPPNCLLEAMLVLHDKECGDKGTCVHGTYPLALQTRASLIARLKVSATDTRWVIRWRHGRPCENAPWQEFILPVKHRD